jgi:hypothetical protein
MFGRTIVPVLALVAMPAAALAQHGGTLPPRTAPPEAAQFDFLVGEWELTVTPKATGLAARLHGAPRLVGTWKVWRAFDGWGVEDELRIMDRSGNPISLTHALRTFNATRMTWLQTTLDVYRGEFTSATAGLVRGEMVVDSRGTDAEGQAYVARMRFLDIKPGSFTVRQDRSTDGGRSWDRDVLVIEAKRTGPAPTR